MEKDLFKSEFMDIQQKLGADIAMVFDECIAFGTERKYAEDSVDRTTRWERRCKAHVRPDQSLFGIVQGGFWPGCVRNPPTRYKYRV